MRRDLLRGDVAVVASVVAGKAPEVGPVVDVEHHLGTALLGNTDRLALGSIGVRLGKMRAGDEDGPGGANEVFGNIVFAQRAVSAQLSR